MKAVTLAGGFGTRLKPITYTRPKPMIQVVGKPVIEYIVEYLHSYGLSEIILTSNYLKNHIINHLGYGEQFGVNIIYPEEENPLGTAGSVKNVEQILDETFLVIQGDNITDYDLTKLIKFHKESGGLATIAVCPVPDPEHYGVVVVDPDFGVNSFQEKPGPSECKSNLINTGVYVLEPEVLDIIPDKTKFDFSRDLFPILCGRGQLYAWPAQGFWTDVGQLSGLNQAKEYLIGNVSPKISDSATVLGELGEQVFIGENVYVGKGAVIQGPSVINDNSIIEDNCLIGPKTCIGSNLVVKEGARIIGSELFSDTRIGRGNTVENAWISENCHIGSNSHIRENSILGANCILGLSVQVEAGSRIWPNMDVCRGSNVSGDIRTFWQTSEAKYNPKWSLRDLSRDEAFYFNKREENRISHTGYYAKNLFEFNEIVTKVDLNSILYHFREDKNDFSEWARRIICDPVLSQSFDRIKICNQANFTEDIRKGLHTETFKRINHLKTGKRTT